MSEPIWNKSVTDEAWGVCWSDKCIKTFSFLELPATHSSKATTRPSRSDCGYWMKKYIVASCELFFDGRHWTAYRAWHPFRCVIGTVTEESKWSLWVVSRCMRSRRIDSDSTSDKSASDSVSFHKKLLRLRTIFVDAYERDKWLAICDFCKCATTKASNGCEFASVAIKSVAKYTWTSTFAKQTQTASIKMSIWTSFLTACHPHPLFLNDWRRYFRCFTPNPATNPPSVTIYLHLCSSRQKSFNESTFFLCVLGQLLRLLHCGRVKSQRI